MLIRGYIADPMYFVITTYGIHFLCLEWEGVNKLTA
jgi:hypothetical protein